MQRGAVDVFQVDTGIDRKTACTLARVNGASGVAAADLALERVEGDGLAVAADDAADRAQLEIVG